MGEESGNEQVYRIVDRDGGEVASQSFANLDQATSWTEQEAMDRGLSKWTLQVHQSGEWVDRVSTRR